MLTPHRLPASPSRKLLILVLPLLLAPLAPCEEPAESEVKPLDRVSSKLKKTIALALLGHEESLATLAETPPLTAKAAGEVEKKVLPVRRFEKLKPGRDRREIEEGSATGVYGLSVPKGYTPRRAWPVILSLHGAGGNGPGEIDWIWSRNLADWPGFIVAPSGQPPGAQWFPEQEAFVLAVLRDLSRIAQIDSNRVYLNGFSNGGNGAWYYAQCHPGIFAAMCTRGGGNPNPSLLVNLLRVPTYVIHGENDGTIQVDSDRRDAKALQDLGYEVVYTEVAGGGHSPFHEENPKVLDFFTRHPRDPWPHRLVCRPPGSERFRNLWLELPAGASAGTVTAELDPETSQIAITGASKVVLWLSDALLDLDADLTVTLGGQEAHRGPVPRRLADMVADFQDRQDRTAIAWARLELGE